MRNKNLLFVLFLSMLFSGCRKLEEFKIRNSAEFVIPQSTPVGIYLPTPAEVTTSSDYEFKSNGTAAKHVKEVKLDELKLTIVNPSSQTFKFLNSIQIYISATDLPEVEIAYLHNIPSTVGNSIDLVTTGVDLEEYIKRDSYQLKVKSVTDELLAQDVTIKSEMTFRVKAKVL